LRAAEITGLRSAAEKSGLVDLLGDAGKVFKMVPRVGPGAGLKNLERLAASGQPSSPTRRAAYFAGCFAANLDTEEAAATVRILHRQGVEVSVPHFGCCGIPAPAYGDRLSALALARKNIALAKNLKVDAIVTSCASCGSFLKEYARLFKADEQMAEAAREFSAKVKDLSEFLVDTGLSTDMGALKEKATYHDPCHQARYQKIKLQPRKILKAIPGVEFVEMNESDMCCGAAGSYGFKNFDLSMKVLDRKMGNIQKSGATLVASSCPACIMQLRAGVKRHGAAIRTLSIVKLLDEAYRRKPGR
jgi:glycolate oxidase iron-sulfur subunit